MSKRAIIDQIKRLAAENGGMPLGETTFRNKTGITKSAWFPDLWLNWGDAIEEAGFARNKFQTAIDETVIFEKYIGLVRELGHLPVDGELIRKRNSDRSFPTPTVFLRFGGKEKLVAALLTFCESGSGYNDIIMLGKEYLQSSAQQGAPSTRAKAAAAVSYGYVYLMKSGRHYKIGHTNSVGRREWELGIKIPIPPKTVHYIKTDDPAGIEAYWHKRFSEKRGEGEWFDLSKEDVAAFKRWKRIV